MPSIDCLGLPAYNSRRVEKLVPGNLLNIIVCVDPRRCLALGYRGRNSMDILRSIQELAREDGLEDRVKATPCRCIFGCTYGPRIDVINRATGEKTLYGSVGGPVEISVRGRVNMEQIPGDLRGLFREAPSQASAVSGGSMLREILEDCQQGFAEVVMMLSNEATSAEIYAMFDDLRFSDNNDIVTFMAEGGTHLHLYMEQVKEAKFIHTTNEQGLPSYSLWLMNQGGEPLLRVYLRKSEREETNQPRHDHFVGLIEKYGEVVSLAG